MKSVIDDLGIVIAAGGSGARFGGGNKLLARLDGAPVFVHSVRRLATLCPPAHRVMVVPSEEKSAFEEGLRRFAPDVEIKIVAGGSTRMLSVFNGLRALPESCRIAAAHDAARPLADAGLLARCHEACATRGGAVVGRPATDTVKVTDSRGYVVSTPDRSTLWTVQTPQVFFLDTLLKAYEKALSEGREFPDDAAVMEHSGHRTFLLRDDSCNIKITYPEDLVIAENLLRFRQNQA